MAPKIAVIYYSAWGHIAKLAKAELEGVKQAGGTADEFQIRETLPQEVLTAMHIPPQDPSTPFITPDKMKEYDGFLFGIPTRFGNYSAQWKTFIDSTGPIWMSGDLHGKPFGMFISTGGLGGGQEATALAAMSTWVHHGMVFVPLGSKNLSPDVRGIDEVRGGSAWGAGTFAHDGTRQPTEKELKMATIQGKQFWDWLTQPRK